MNIILSKNSIFFHGQRRVDEIRKFFGNYIYYRKCNHSHSVAWRMAKNTL